MKAFGARFSFYVGFLCGTVTLYMFLQHFWFQNSLSMGSYGGSDEHQLEQKEELKNWKKDRSALFNLNHPHHKGTVRDVSPGGSRTHNIQPALARERPANQSLIDYTNIP